MTIDKQLIKRLQFTKIS